VFKVSKTVGKTSYGNVLRDVDTLPYHQKIQLITKAEEVPYNQEDHTNSDVDEVDKMF
jgi:hypothetical protein